MILLLLLASLASAQTEASWNVDQTQHFTIHHEGMSSSLGTNNLVERIYEALHPALWPLVPWMTQTKIDVYLYRSRESFLKGRFHPPFWSGGLMTETANEKALAVFEPLDTGVVAHELTHLYFHTFFDEKSASPPAWLDEGLAMELQDDALTMSDPRETGPVIAAPMPMKTLLRSRPAQDTPAARVNAWYQQAHSVVRFLRRGHIESLFTDYCGKLRDGGDPEAALLAVYGYADLNAFEAAWLKWRPKKAKGQSAGLEP
jgi:hypothetical protein